MDQARRGGLPLVVLRRHWPLAVLVAAGVLLRVLTAVAERPALLLWGDSYQYLHDAHVLRTSQLHPLGYGVVLRALTAPTGRLDLVVAVQHAAGVLVAVGVYVVLLRVAARRWLATAAAAPVLLAVTQLSVEQAVLSDVLFQGLLAAALLLCLRGGRPGVRRAAAVGLLLTGLALTRTVGVFVAPVVVLLALLRRWGWAPATALLVATVAPVVAYASVYRAQQGQAGLAGTSAAWMYGRLQVAVPCHDVALPLRERRLCTRVRFPAGTPAIDSGVTFYTWSSHSPRTGVANSVVGDYDRRLLRAHPWRYAVSVGVFAARYFDPDPHDDPDTWPVATWRFAPAVRPATTHLVLGRVRVVDNGVPSDASLAAAAPQPLSQPISLLRAYQAVTGWVWGPATGLAGAVALVGCAVAVARRGVARRPGLVGACGLLLGSGLTLLVVPAATVAVEYRYLLPLYVTLWPAGLLGAQLLCDRPAPARRAGGARRRPTAAP